MQPLETLGYKKAQGVYEHPERKVIRDALSERKFTYIESVKGTANVLHRLSNFCTACQGSYFSRTAYSGILFAIFTLLALMFVAATVGHQTSSGESSQRSEKQIVNDNGKNLWTTEGEDWPRFLGAGVNGVSNEKGIKLDWSDGKMRVRWKIDTGEGYGMGSVANGRFFHFGKYGEEAVLKCFHAETGRPLWRFAYASDYVDKYGYDSGPRASPVIDGDRVYIFGVEGVLHCLDCVSGKKIWSVDTAKQFGVVQNFFGVGSTPLIYQDKLLVMIGGSPQGGQQVPVDFADVKPNSSGIVAFDKLTGDVKYRSIDQLASYSSLNLMTLNDKPVALAWMRDAMIGFDPASGEQKFSFPWRARKLESVNAMTPVVLGDKVFLSESYQNGGLLLDVSTDEPKSVWDDAGKRQQAMATHWNTPVVSGDYLYGCSGQHSGSAEIRCVNWKTGEVTWAHRGLGRASLTKIQGHLIVLGEQGELMLIKDDPTKWNLVTIYETAEEDQLELNMPCWSAPIVSHGLLWIRGKSTLACLELAQ